jgi:benzodiazapine receptor
MECLIMMRNEILKLTVSILVCQLAGIIGAFFTTPAIPTWYAALNKPPFTPPNWVFGPVWTTLYFLMGIAVFLIWRQGFHTPQVRTALLIFGLQLLLNVIWSLAFFGLRSPTAGVMVIVFLWTTILWTMWKFYPLSWPAAILLTPYILWVSYAAVLNISIMVLNS